MLIRILLAHFSTLHFDLFSSNASIIHKYRQFERQIPLVHLLIFNNVSGILFYSLYAMLITKFHLVQ